MPPFPAESRASGLPLYVASLPSAYGVGDAGPGAFARVDRLPQSGQSGWQALPLGPTGDGNSRHQSLSPVAGHALLISPDFLIEDELLRANERDGRSFSATSLAYHVITVQLLSPSARHSAEQTHAEPRRRALRAPAWLRDASLGHRTRAAKCSRAANVTLSKPPGTWRRRSTCARKPHPLFRADRFRSWGARR